MKRTLKKKTLSRYAVLGEKILEYGILRFYIMMIPQKCSKGAVRNAVKEWDVKIEPLELEEVSSRKNSDIRIEFRDGNDDEGNERKEKTLQDRR